MRYPSSFVWLALGTAACGAAPVAETAADGPTCEQRRGRLVQLLQQLPERPQSLSLRISLPTSSLGGALGEGVVLEISEDWVALDGEPIQAPTDGQTWEEVSRRLRNLTSDAPQTSRAPRGNWLGRAPSRHPSTPSPTAAPTPPAPLAPPSAPTAAATTAPAPSTPAPAPSATPEAATPAASALPATAAAPEPPPPQATSGRPPLYIAAAKDTDIRTLQAYLAVIPDSLEPKLLFGAPPLVEDRSLSGHDLAARVFAERHPARRYALAAEGYQAYSNCSEVDAVVASVDGLGPDQRWPKLRTGFLQAVPNCECEELDPESLGYLAVAEQRAGGVAVGSLPIDFLEDDRCSAAMPLRTAQQVLGDIERFEEEFSGEWQGDALHFEEVLTSERLLTHLCVALPGETLAALQRARRSLYWRTQSGACHPWQFEPLSPGAPLGTWRRLDSSGQPSPVALHYRQYSEEIRLFGPVSGQESRPTDEGPFECAQDFHMVSVDDASIALENGGRWFLDEAACRAGSAADAMPAGCVADLAATP